MKTLQQTKPTYTVCHATSLGWVETSTGELLVAVKGLLDIVKRKPGRPKKS